MNSTRNIMKNKLKQFLALALGIFSIGMSAAQGGRIEYARFPVKMLANVTERDYAVYLPDNYDTDTSKTYPVLYLLHGGYGSFTDWPTAGNLKAVADSLISAGTIQPLVIICPDGRYRNNTMWFDMDNWTPEEHFFDELMPYMESNYRIRSDKNGRAIAGLSLGGGAALGYAFQNPDKFIASCGMSAYIESVAKVVNPGIAWIQPVVNENNPIIKLKGATDKEIDSWKTVSWFIDCGDKDFTIQSNTQLDETMNSLRIPHEFLMRNGAHDWNYWNGSLPLVLCFINNAFSTEH